jgi:hypothetical protein
VSADATATPEWMRLALDAAAAAAAHTTYDPLI